MKAVLQRVKSASVTVNDQLVSTIGRGILVLAGVGKGDDEKEAENLVSKVLKMRLWPDDNGGQVSWPGAEASVICVWTTAKNRTVEEERAGYRGRDTLWYVIFPVPGLDITSPDKQSVSQFTLYGQMKKGSKPDFHEAADVETARRLYDYFYQRLREAYKPERVKNGVFQAMMDVELKNDGPVGLNYRSYEEAVQLYSAMEALNGADPGYAYRSLSRLIQGSPRRKRNLKKGIIKKPIAARVKRARRGMNSRFPLNCCNKE